MIRRIDTINKSILMEKINKHYLGILKWQIIWDINISKETLIMR